MSRPTFISGLLAEVGTAINPITLVRRIPSGLEIEGLKDGLKKMIREYDLQDSISTGVAKVLQGEVAVGMERLRKGRRKGIKFDVTAGGKVPVALKAALCASCGKGFGEDETETLVAFACGHIYHLSHLLYDQASSQPPSRPPEGARDVADDDGTSSATLARTIGPKVTNAVLLRYKIEGIGGCRMCKVRKAKEAKA